MNIKKLRRAFDACDFDGDGLLNGYELTHLGERLFGNTSHGELYLEVCELCNANPLFGLDWDDIIQLFMGNIQATVNNNKNLLFVEIKEHFNEEKKQMLDEENEEEEIIHETKKERRKRRKRNKKKKRKERKQRKRNLKKLEKQTTQNMKNHDLKNDMQYEMKSSDDELLYEKGMNKANGMPNMHNIVSNGSKSVDTLSDARKRDLPPSEDSNCNSDDDERMRHTSSNRKQESLLSCSSITHLRRISAFVMSGLRGGESSDDEKCSRKTVDSNADGKEKEMKVDHSTDENEDGDSEIDIEMGVDVELQISSSLKLDDTSFGNLIEMTAVSPPLMTAVQIEEYFVLKVEFSEMKKKMELKEKKSDVQNDKISELEMEILQWEDKFSELQQQKSNIGDRYRKLQKQFNSLQDMQEQQRETIEELSLHQSKSEVQSNVEIQDILSKKQEMGKSIQEMIQTIKHLEDMCANYQRTEDELRMEVRKCRSFEEVMNDLMNEKIALNNNLLQEKENVQQLKEEILILRSSDVGWKTKLQENNHTIEKLEMQCQSYEKQLTQMINVSEFSELNSEIIDYKKQLKQKTINNERQHSQLEVLNLKLLNANSETESMKRECHLKIDELKDSTKKEKISISKKYESRISKLELNMDGLEDDNESLKEKLKELVNEKTSARIHISKDAHRRNVSRTMVSAFMNTLDGGQNNTAIKNNTATKSNTAVGVKKKKSDEAADNFFNMFMDKYSSTALPVDNVADEDDDETPETIDPAQFFLLQKAKQKYGDN